MNHRKRKRATDHLSKSEQRSQEIRIGAQAGKQGVERLRQSRSEGRLEGFIAGACAAALACLFTSRTPNA